MIAPYCFKKDWLEKLRERHSSGDPALMERMICAFELLGQLAEQEEDFVFKGGTALVLLLPTVNRVSIDVDIQGNIDTNNLDTLCEGTVFKRVEEDRREAGDIPKRHFRFYFDSSWEDREQYVLLDFVDDSSVYPELREVAIETDFFEVERGQTVRVPKLAGLLADKLTAFAPGTIGIPYEDEAGSERSLEIMKQLHDIGVLFNEVESLGEVEGAYRRIQEQENEYRGADFPREEILRDTLQTSEKVSLLEAPNVSDDRPVELLRRGVDRLHSHLLEKRMTVDRAIESSSRAGFLAASLLTGKVDRPLTSRRFDESKLPSLEDAELVGEWDELQYLKRRNPEAFYYWVQVSEMLGSDF